MFGIVAVVVAFQSIPPPPPGYVVDKPNVFEDLIPKPERLGPGPHTLVITSGQAVTRIDYKSGQACQHAKETVLQQTGTKQLPNGGYIFSSVTAFCVPR